jgi:hypothetical protein
VAGIDGVLDGKSVWCHLCRRDKSAGKPGSVTGPLTWLTENPGRQLLTGSFHPVSDERWTDGAYVAGETAKLKLSFAAACAGNAEILTENVGAVKNANNATNEDGKTLLHVSVLNGHWEW